MNYINNCSECDESSEDDMLQKEIELTVKYNAECIEDSMTSSKIERDYSTSKGRKGSIKEKYSSGS